jgi:hypothetical protein
MNGLNKFLPRRLICGTARLAAHGRAGRVFSLDAGQTVDAPAVQVEQNTAGYNKVIPPQERNHCNPLN